MIIEALILGFFIALGLENIAQAIRSLNKK